MCQCHTTGVAPEFHFVPGELWVSLLYGCPGPHCPQPLGAAPSPGTGGAEGPFPAPLLGKGNPGQPLPPCPGCRGFLEPRWMEQSSLPAPAPLNNGAPGTDSCLAANGPWGLPAAWAAGRPLGKRRWMSHSPVPSSHLGQPRRMGRILLADRNRSQARLGPVQTGLQCLGGCAGTGTGAGGNSSGSAPPMSIFGSWLSLVPSGPGPEGW